MVLLADVVTGFDELIAQALMVPLGVIVVEVSLDRPAQRVFIKKDDPGQALGLDASHESLDVDIQVRAAGR
jgi:hypothetical protein